MGYVHQDASFIIYQSETDPVFGSRRAALVAAGGFVQDHAARHRPAARDRGSQALLGGTATSDC